VTEEFPTYRPPPTPRPEDAAGRPAQGERPPLTCLVCGGTGFRSEKSVEPRSGFGLAHKMTLLICTNCDFVMQFYGHGRYSR
jgi:hypothetical protein